MKNLFILPTNKPSRLANRDSNNKLEVSEKNTLFVNGFGFTPQNIYITSDEEIKKGDWCLYNKNHNSRNQDWILIKCGKIESEEMHPISEGKLLLWMIKIILTTDQDLIKDGIQPVPDDFLDWFVKNPSCEEVEVGYGWIRLTETDNEGYWVSIPNKQFEMQQEEPKHPKVLSENGNELFFDKEGNLIKEEPKQENLEEVVFKRYPRSLSEKDSELRNEFLMGAKWQQEQDKKLYSEKEVLELLNNFNKHTLQLQKLKLGNSFNVKEWFEQFKKK